jgi:hypothetical protein
MDNAVYRMGFAESPAGAADRLARSGGQTDKTTIPPGSSRWGQVTGQHEEEKEYFTNVSETVASKSVPTWIARDVEQMTDESNSRKSMRSALFNAATIAEYSLEVGNVRQQLYRGAAAVVQQPDEPLISREASDEYARIVASPLPPGFDHAGNAFAARAPELAQGRGGHVRRIDGVQHEFSTIPNVKEDTIEFLRTLKRCGLRALRPSRHAGAGHHGRTGAITASDITVPGTTRS